MAEKLALKLFELFPENSVSYEFILQNANAIFNPPLKSTIRINKIDNTYIEQSLIILKKIICTQGKFSIRIIPEINYVAEIDCIGPNQWFPVDRRVIISIEAGISVLRGSHIFVAGIISIEDVLSFSNGDDKSKVSVWVDLSRKCTMGMRKRYTGDVKCIGNGHLLMVGYIL